MRAMAKSIEICVFCQKNRQNSTKFKTAFEGSKFNLYNKNKNI